MKKFFCWLLISAVLWGCVPASSTIQAPVITFSSPTPSRTPTNRMVITITPVITPSSTQTPSPSPTPLPSPSPTSGPVFTGLCSPLEGISLPELSSPDLLKTLFESPRPGWDEGHHGVDFAYWSRGERKTMRGHPVLSVMAGQVAAVLPERMPYGNAVIIETRLDLIPPDWLASIPALSATALPTVQAVTLFCPPSHLSNSRIHSLYLLYAHLNQPSPLHTGQQVACGEPIGVVGTTGKSVNDHLHLETRVGPAGVTFPAMAHYQNDVTEAETSAYCAWRVSGLFEMIDPMEILSLKP